MSDSSTTRPDRLLSRIKLINSSIDDSAPRLIVIRSPKGPDGKGFSSIYRQPRLVGECIADSRCCSTLRNHMSVTNALALCHSVFLFSTGVFAE